MLHKQITHQGVVDYLKNSTHAETSELYLKSSLGRDIGRLYPLNVVADPPTLPGPLPSHVIGVLVTQAHQLSNRSLSHMIVLFEVYPVTKHIFLRIFRLFVQRNQHV